MTHIRKLRAAPEGDTRMTPGRGFSNGQAHPDEPPVEAAPEEVVTDSEATAIDEIRTIASQLQASVVERVLDNSSPFEQQAHTLLLEGIDRITQQWVAELGHVRDNTKVIEQKVIAQAAKVKDEITKLHLLGIQAMKEAERGRAVSLKLEEELDAMLLEHGETH